MALSEVPEAEHATTSNLFVIISFLLVICRILIPVAMVVVRAWVVWRFFFLLLLLLLSWSLLLFQFLLFLSRRLRLIINRLILTIVIKILIKHKILFIILLFKLTNRLEEVIFIYSRGNITSFFNGRVFFSLNICLQMFIYFNTLVSILFL